MTCGTGGSFKPPTFPVGVDSIDIMHKSASAESECMRTPGLDQELYHSRTSPNSGRRRSLQLPFAPCLEKPNLGKKEERIRCTLWAAAVGWVSRGVEGEHGLPQPDCSVYGRHRFQPSEQHQRDMGGPTFRDSTACRRRTGGKPFPGGEASTRTAWQSTSQGQRQQILGVLGPDGKQLGGWATARDAEGKHSLHILAYSRVAGNKTTSPQKDDQETESIRGVQYEKHSIPVELPTPDDVKQNKTKT
ncbi:hypothetical protein B0H13DRAFT_1903003 [Mycena leptocephala]|nr:hypothetical protein B0H13DRAFT_1903003 [Mycena leptocephala]